MIQARKRNKKTRGSTYYLYDENNKSFLEFLQLGTMSYYLDISVNLDINGRAILYKENKEITTKFYNYDSNTWEDTVVTLPCYSLLSDGILNNIYTTGVDNYIYTPNDYEVPYLYNNVVVDDNVYVTVEERNSIDGTYTNVYLSGVYSNSYYHFPSGTWSDNTERQYKAAYLKSSFASSPINGLIIKNPFNSVKNGATHDTSYSDCIQSEIYGFPMGAFSIGDQLSRNIDTYNFFWI